MTAINKVFVYGTLKQGQRNFHYLQAAEFIGNFNTNSIYSMYAFDDYPAVCIHGRHSIRGEVYHVSDSQFQQLDELEHYPEFYQRIEILTSYGDAWMYVVKSELCLGRPRISGIWP